MPTARCWEPRTPGAHPTIPPGARSRRRRARAVYRAIATAGDGLSSPIDRVCGALERARYVPSLRSTAPSGKEQIYETNAAGDHRSRSGDRRLRLEVLEQHDLHVGCHHAYDDHAEEETG